MKNRRLIAGFLSIGLLGTIALTSGQATAATKTTKKKVAVKTTKKATATTAAPAATTAPAATAAPASGGSSGGNAVFGVDAETNNWLPGPGSWGAAAYVVTNAVYDTLIMATPEGKLVPSLLASLPTATPDFKTWTLKVRPGIKFHNGEDLNAEAVAISLEHVRTGATTATALVNLQGCAAIAAMTVECKTKTAWAPFPYYLTGQAGTVPAPAQIKANDGKKPIGTGPFMCKGDCWVPNQKITLTKNPTYWRGGGLPKLDSLEVRPIPDEDQRLAQLQSGQIQFLETGNFLTGRDLAKLDKDKKVNLLISENGGGTAYDIPNLARKGPMQDVRVRKAWAYAIDLDTLISLRAPGASKANGLFLEGTLGYLKTAGYEFNLDKAKALIEDYKKDKGVSSVPVTLQSTAVPDNQQTIAVMKQMLDKAGFNINIGPGLEQAAYIQAVLTGNFEVMTWNFPPQGALDPDQGRPFLSSEGCGGPNVCPVAIGFSVLNWPRNVDAFVDTAMDQIRTNTDPVVRKAAAEAVERAYNDNVYMMFRWRSRYHLAGCAKCTMPTETGPNNEKLMFAPSGRFAGQAWLTVG